jgi:hypothetical protein
MSSAGFHEEQQLPSYARKHQPPGVFQKFTVKRNDGRDGHGQKHEFCTCFVLDPIHDENALKALQTYAESCKDKEPALASDLFNWIERIQKWQSMAPRFGGKE